MPIIHEQEISNAIQLFSERDVRLTHACQLSDFQSYLELGGIPSRSLLETKSLPFTQFDTDSDDKKNQVWHKVFLNLGDFGDWFARGKYSLPNPYGPITFVFHPTVLLNSQDFSICLRSAGAKGFDREREGISIEEIPTIFVDSNGPRRHVKFTRDLKRTFPDRIVTSSPEMSVTYGDELADIGLVRFILVDNYPKLANSVRNELDKKCSNIRVFERRTNAVRKMSYERLWNAISEERLTLNELMESTHLTKDLKNWAEEVSKWDTQSFHFNRFAKYLLNGTIKKLA